MNVHICLLRAVNVGGTAKLPMKALRAACEAAGLLRVETIGASGNVVFESALGAKAAEAAVAAVLRNSFGLSKNHAIVRSADDVARAMAANPFVDAARERPSLLTLFFMAGEPRADAARVFADHAGPERARLLDDVLYVDFVNGAGRSKLTPAFLDKALKTPATARNWNTCGKLLAMARARKA
jgi:uncharacterized protein (DUF1697 family)